MERIRIFISSRVNSTSNTPGLKFSLKELRAFLRDQLESETFFEERIIDVVINETDFHAPLARNAFNHCMQELRDSHVVIILYNGEAGWGIEGYQNTNGICHEEFLVAANDFSEMTFLVDISQYFSLPKEGDAFERNAQYQKDISDQFNHKDTIDATTLEELKEKLLKQCQSYILKSVLRSVETQKRKVAGSTVFGETLNWNKQSYSERETSLHKFMEEAFEGLPDFKETIKQYHAIPDNMSVADARNLIGRPFLKEHSLLGSSSLQSGVIHFVGVYGRATEIQVKNLVGYPDLAVIKTPFGFYLWEKNVHIQIFFLVNCINPATVRTRFSEVVFWLKGSKEKERILTRAKARYSILNAIVKSQGLSGL